MQLSFDAAPSESEVAQEHISEARISAWLPQTMHRPNRVEYFEDTTGVAWPEGHVLPSGTRSVELQNLCGFRAYAELRLGSSELGAPEPGVAPDVRGQLLHAALQTLWAELRDSETLARHSDSTLDSLIERSVNKAADTLLGRAEDGERAPVFARECRRTSRLIKKLCVLERSRDAFQVEDTEFEKTLAVAGAQMRVRIDRLDALKTGGRAILDYKSGRRTTADWYGERPSHPQLLAYLAAIGEGVVAMATVNVTAREVRFDGIANSPQLLPKVKGVEPPRREHAGPPETDHTRPAKADRTGPAKADPAGPPETDHSSSHKTDQARDAWAVWTREWRECIDRLASQFIAGRAVLNPKPGACDYCHAVSLCRISDRGIDVAAELLPAEFDGVVSRWP